MVYVLSKNNKPLMPCTNVIARLLLKQNKAKIKQKEPFIIKLIYKTTEYTQDLILGIDTGSKIIGAAVSKNNGDIVYMSKVIIRNNITNKMKQRSIYRRNRRSKKLRYRKARFLNRKNNIKDNRFSPTMISKIHSHIREIEFIKSILPINQLVLETGKFDCHLMKNPLLANNSIKYWGYQQGLNYGFENTKAKVLYRDNYTCQICLGKHKDSKLEVHHIIFKSQGGSDEEDNLITLCHTCHNKLHHNKLKINLIGKKKENLKYASQMNSIRCQLLKIYPKAFETLGYITKVNRLALNISKDHHLDACIIATNGLQPTFITKNLYIKRHISKGDYQRTHGVRSQIILPKGKIQGFKRFDKVKYLGYQYFISSRHSTGYLTLMDIEGNKIDFSNLPRGFKTPKINKCQRISARKTTIINTISL